MRFVSKSPEFRKVIRHDTTEWRRDRNGTDVRVTIEDAYTAEFKQGWLKPHEKAAAIRHWAGMGNRDDNSMKGFLAHPLLQGTAQDAESWDPRSRLSVFDTEWIEDEKLRELAEEVLLAGASGEWYIHVPEERLPEPWPGYDDMRGVKGRPLAETIALMAVSTGRVREALEYERETKKRPGVVAALEAELGREAERAAEDEALTAEVPG